MNDLDTHFRNDAIDRDRHDKRAGDRNAENRQQHRLRRRWGGRLFAFGGFVLLAGGLSLGARGSHSQQQEVMATAEQAREVVPSLRVATIEPSPGTVSVTLPGTTAAFAAANIYARATGYIDKRNVDSAIASRQEICSPGSPCQSSMTRFHRTRPLWSS